MHKCGKKNGSFFFGVLTIMAKSYQSVNQQINILTSRGMKFKDLPKAKQVLNHKNYYNLINGYKKLILDSSATIEQYLPNLYFEEIVEVSSFDRNLRALFLKYILYIEDELRRHIAHEFAKNHGSDTWDDVNSYESSTSRTLAHVNNLITKLNRINSRVNQDSHDDMLQHFSSRGDKTPIWALVNDFEFGTSKSFYFNMKSLEKDTIARDYYSLNFAQLKTFLETLNMFRNVFAHDYRCLFYRIYDRDKQISSMPLHTNMHIETLSIATGITFKYGKNDLFAVVIIFKYMLSQEVFKKFFYELKRLIKNLKRKIKTIDIDEVLLSLGFPLKESSGQYDWSYIIKANK